MNKRVFLLAVGMVLSLVMIGVAFAVSYFDASPSTGTVTTDGCFLLTLGGDNVSEITLEEDKPSWYKIELSMERSSDNAAQSAKGMLDITLTPRTDMTVEGVTIEVFENQSSTTPLATVLGKSSGAATSSVLDIGGEVEIYWLKISLSQGHTANELEKIAGDINIVFKMQ